MHIISEDIESNVLTGATSTTFICKSKFIF